MAVEIFANVPTTTVTSGGTTAPASGTQETWTVASSASFPAASSSALPPTQFHVADVALNSEIISVINVSGTTWTVIRGAESTTPVAHGAGFTIYQVVSADAYTQLRAVDWLNVATQFGADPTGSADSTTAIQNAINALPATGGTVYLPGGTYKSSSALTATPPVRIFGAGKDQVTISYTGSGDCLRVHTTTSLAGYAKAILEGFTIDGTHASAGSAGLHYGDTIQGHLDIAVSNFQGSGSKGVWFDNQYNYTEMTTGRLYVKLNTVNVLFDNSANPSGTATNSFDRTILDIFINQNGVGDGIVFQNGALMFDGRLGIYGNFQNGASQYSVLRLSEAPSYSFTATNASPCVFTASGSYYSNGTPVTLSGGSLPAGFTATTYYVVNASGATFQLSATSGGSAINSTSTGSGNVIVFQQSGIYQSVLDIGVELDGGGPGATVPYTIYFGSAQKTVIAGCRGVMDFAAAATFASTSNTPGYFRSFQFDGPVFGDDALGRTAGGVAPLNTGTSLSSGGSIDPLSEIYTTTPTSDLTGMILTKWPGIIGAPVRVMVVNRSTTYSITFGVSGTSNVSTGTSCVIYPGASMLFAWNEFESQWCPAAGTVFPAFSVTGLTGATAGCRLVGAIASGTAPVSGTFLTGDVIIVLTGSIIICTAGGSPGTWAVA